MSHRNSGPKTGGEKYKSETARRKHDGGSEYQELAGEVMRQC